MGSENVKNGGQSLRSSLPPSSMGVPPPLSGAGEPVLMFENS